MAEITHLLGWSLVLVSGGGQLCLWFRLFVRFQTCGSPDLPAAFPSVSALYVYTQSLVAFFAQRDMISPTEMCGLGKLAKSQSQNCSVRRGAFTKNGMLTFSCNLFKFYDSVTVTKNLFFILLYFSWKLCINLE